MAKNFNDKFNLLYDDGLIIPVESDTRDLETRRRMALNMEISQLNEEIKKLKARIQECETMVAPLNKVIEYLGDAKLQAERLEAIIPCAYKGGSSNVYVANVQSAFLEIGTNKSKAESLLEDIIPIIKDIEEEIRNKETRLRQLRRLLIML